MVWPNREVNTDQQIGAHPLIVGHALANRIRKLVTLPPGLQSPPPPTLARRRASTGGLK